MKQAKVNLKANLRSLLHFLFMFFDDSQVRRENEQWLDVFLMAKSIPRSNRFFNFTFFGMVNFRNSLKFIQHSKKWSVRRLKGCWGNCCGSSHSSQSPRVHSVNHLIATLYGSVFMHFLEMWIFCARNSIKLGNYWKLNHHSGVVWSISNKWIYGNWVLITANDY